MPPIREEDTFFLAHGVTVALQILVLSVEVRILMGQQSKAQDAEAQAQSFSAPACALSLVALTMPCSIMVVRQILALNVRVRILARQQTCSY